MVAVRTPLPFCAPIAVKPMSDEISVPNGLVVIPTYGVIQAATAKAMWDARAVTEAKGLKGIAWEIVPGSLVERCRNDACRKMLQGNFGWILMADGDMIWAPESILQMLQTAYGSHPWVDVLGGYCNLRGDLAIPTIDSGTGTWESHYPGSGVKEVMRTGGAFLLVKRHVCERIPQPWFATRVPMRPMDAMAEIDNFARIKFDGSNPFRKYPEWATLEGIAQSDPSTHPGVFVPAEVGEDSGFCDRVRAFGMRIAVNTDIVTIHLDTKETSWKTHKEAMGKRDQEHRFVCGLLA